MSYSRRPNPGPVRFAVLAVALVVAVAFIGGIVWAFSSGSNKADPTCSKTAAVREFSLLGHNPKKIGGKSPIFNKWEALYCSSRDLGPATSSESKRAGFWQQSFNRTAHLIVWKSGTKHALVLKQPAVAAKVFARDGIHPQWQLPTPAAWLSAFYGGHDYGPALEPVRMGASTQWQQQAFATSRATYQKGTVIWSKATKGSGTRLTNASLWLPISRTVSRFGTALRNEDSPASALYLSTRLATKALDQCPQMFLGFDGWPKHSRFAIQLWNTSKARVKSAFRTGHGRVVEQIGLSKRGRWRITSVRSLHGTVRNPTCPPWTPPANAFPGTYAVGDSVMVDAQPFLNPMGITVDAAVSRQFETGISILQQLKSEGQLPPRVVIGLGTNGGMTASEYEYALRMLSGEKRVVLLTVRVPDSWQGPVNALVHQMAKKFKNVRVADWYAVSADHPEWFAYDGIHLQYTGAEAFAHTVANALAAP